MDGVQETRGTEAAWEHSRTTGDGQLTSPVMSNSLISRTRGSAHRGRQCSFTRRRVETGSTVWCPTPSHTVLAKDPGRSLGPSSPLTGGERGQEGGGKEEGLRVSFYGRGAP